MQETLKAAFGEWGAILAQFLITVVVVLVLIALVYWLVRRYSGIRLGGIGRGRVPRLAVVDAMAIDSRRQLVLVRRDNVEHLILIGGPADLVVEPSIQRPRARPAQQPQPGTAAAPVAQAPAPSPQPAPPLFPPEEMEAPRAPTQPREPIPFPQARSNPRPAAGNDRITLRPLNRPLSPPPEPLPPLPPTRAEPDHPAWAGTREAASAFHPQPAEPQAMEQVPLPDFMTAAAAEPEPVATAAVADAATGEPSPTPALDLGEDGAPAIDPAEPPQSGEPAGATTNDLEREMARLLGEFGSRRPP